MLVRVKPLALSARKAVKRRRRQHDDAFDTQ